MGTGNACQNIRDLGVRRSVSAQRGLDAALGFNAMTEVRCAACRGDIEFDTDQIGRSIERCRSCGAVTYSAQLVPRPEGDAYTSNIGGGKRPTRPSTQHLEGDPAIDVLRATRSKRASAPMDPRLVEAKRDFEALLDRERDARRPGRPRGPSTNISRPPPRATRGRVVILDDDPPAIAPSPPPAALPPTSESSMKRTYAPRQCGFCHAEYTPTGSAQRYCSIAHKEADQRGDEPQTKEKKPKRVETGFKPQPSSNGGGYGSMLEELRERLRVLDRERVQLVNAIESLRKLDGAEE